MFPNLSLLSIFPFWIFPNVFLSHSQGNPQNSSKEILPSLFLSAHLNLFHSFAQESASTW